MKFVEHTNDRTEPISIARCRELLGEEAESMTDQDIALIRRHVETMACIVVEMYQEGCRRVGPTFASLCDAMVGNLRLDHERRSVFWLSIRCSGAECPEKRIADCQDVSFK